MLAFAPMMRRLLLMGSLLALIAALLAMWAFRYERSPGLPGWRLADLQAGTPSVPGVQWTGTPDQANVRLSVDSANPRVAMRLLIPEIPAVAGLRLRFRMRARALIPGSEKWQDGRLMIEWHDPSAELPPENNPVGSVFGDNKLGLEEIVVQAGDSPAVPSLRLEHLGRSGEFELSDLEITAVQERNLWKIGRWFLAAAWLAWIIAFVRTWPGISWWRAICASAIWVLMGIHFVVPGPWKIQRAMIPNFQLGGSVAEVPASYREYAATMAETETALAPAPSGAITALGKLPAQGDFALRVKLAISSARPLLHVSLLFAPAFAFAWLIGRWPALVLSLFLAISIELAQIAFGYGFDLVDVGDLITDTAGIALALWLHGVISKRLEGRGSAE